MSLPPPGIYPGVPDREYRAWDALGSTDIKTLATHPAGVFRYRRQNRTESAAFLIGSAAHALILEDREPSWVDATTRATKAYKEAAAINGPLLLASEWDTVRRMRDAVLRNPDAAQLLTGHEAETSLRWDVDGVAVKGRLDAWHRGSQTIVDLKTTRDASPRGFGRAAAEYGYHAQAAHYSDGVTALTGETHDYFIVCVEKEAPYLTAVYEVFPDMLDAGAETVRDGLNAYREATTADDWPTHYEMQPLYLPAWAYPEVELNL